VANRDVQPALDASISGHLKLDVPNSFATITVSAIGGAALPTEHPTVVDNDGMDVTEKFTFTE
jgi:hypothetical protein